MGHPSYPMHMEKQAKSHVCPDQAFVTMNASFRGEQRIRVNEGSGLLTASELTVLETMKQEVEENWQWPSTFWKILFPQLMLHRQDRGSWCKRVRFHLLRQF